MKIINIKDIEDREVTKEPLFTGGIVKTQKIIEEGFEAKEIQILNVKFAPGARNKFHTHTREQILYITEGEGIVATRNHEYKVAPGIAVIIPRGEEHWHGATKNSSFAHLSILGLPQQMNIVE